MINDNCKQLGIKFSWPSEMLLRKRKRDYWHFFRHHTDYAVLGVGSGKVVSRAWTLDHIVCRQEGISVKDLYILSRHPEVTRDASNMVEAVVKAKYLIKCGDEQKKREKLLEQEALKELRRVERDMNKLRKEQELLESQEWRKFCELGLGWEKERNFRAFMERQEALKKERDYLLNNKNIFFLLGETENCNVRLKELKNLIFT